MRCKYIFLHAVFGILAYVFISSLNAGNVLAAELYINVLAVNGTDEAKDKDIKQILPQELKAEDILDVGGLGLDYDVNTGVYYVHGKVTLGPKETKTYKVRIKDLWQVNPADVEDIKKQIDSSFERLKDTEYFERGQKKKEGLNKRLDYIVAQLNGTDNIEKRVDVYRTYTEELKSIRNNAVNVKYWRASAEQEEGTGVVSFVVKIENPSSEKAQKVSPKHYLPAEVKPEHIVDLQGFDIRFDQEKKQSYLIKEEDLGPGESKEYKIGIRDIWSIPQNKIDDLKERARAAYKLLENSKYADSASYLVKNIKEKLDSVEASQKIERTIEEHISAFRANTQSFNLAKKDVETLEDLVQIMREELERSRLKNVLQKIKSLQSIADIAQNLFKKAAKTIAFKVILGIIAFVGIFTIINFAVWGVRSKNAKLEERKKEQEEGKEKEGQA